MKKSLLSTFEIFLVISGGVICIAGNVELATYAVVLACYANLINNRQGWPT